MAPSPGRYVPLYVPQGVLIPRDHLKYAAQECISPVKRKQAVHPYAPVANEARYATSTREPWPSAWRVKDPHMLVALQRALDRLCRAKDGQAARAERGAIERDDDRDAFVDASSVGGRAYADAWAARKEFDGAAELDRWRANDGTGGCGVFDEAALGFHPFGMAETVPYRARRTLGRTALGGRMHGAMVGTADDRGAKLVREPRKRHADALEMELERVREEEAALFKARVHAKEADHVDVADSNSPILAVRGLDDDAPEPEPEPEPEDVVRSERVLLPAVMPMSSRDLKDPHLRMQAISSRDLLAQATPQTPAASPAFENIPTSPLKKKPMFRRS